MKLNRLLIILFLFSHLYFPNLYAQEICFLLSKSIRPYMEMVNTFKEHSDIKSRILNLDDSKIKKDDFNSCNVVVASGSKANYLVKDMKLPQKKIFTFSIYINEAELFISDNNSYTIFLYPEYHQLAQFFRKKGINKIYAPYSDSNTTDFLLKGNDISEKYQDLNIKVEKIHNIDSLVSAIKTHKYKYLWVLPDKIYSSKEIIDYIIEQATLNQVKVIGFNNYFLEGGAYYSVIVDYKKISDLLFKIVKGYTETHIFSSPFDFVNREKK